jgi:hypothetical protein
LALGPSKAHLWGPSKRGQVTRRKGSSWAWRRPRSRPAGFPASCG